VDDRAPAQPQPIVARRHRPSAHEARCPLVRPGREHKADVVEKGRHLAPQVGSRAPARCDLSVKRLAVAFAVVNPWFVFGPILAVWALTLSFLGITREEFPASRGAARLVGAISVLLVILAIGAAIYGGATEKKESKGGEKSGSLQQL